ncbi:hypothetical protein GCM10028805_21580 [Spirosoma harenae]
MYFTGFGDCFLLTFRYDDPLEKPKNLWIDFGARAGKAARMQEIARHLKDYLIQEGFVRNGRPYVDVLAITHEHQDHISGLKQAQAELDGLDIDQVWFAWTEDPTDEMAKAWRKHKKKTREAVQKSLQQVRQGVVHFADQLNRLNQVQDPTQTGQRKAIEQKMNVASNLAHRLNLLAGFEFAAAEDDDNKLDFTLHESYKMLIEKVGESNIRYLRPGYTDPAEKVFSGHVIGQGLTSQPSPTIFPGLKIFVLGPPRDLTIIRAGEPENWQHSLRADASTADFSFDQSEFPNADSMVKKDFWYYVQKAPFDEEFVVPIDCKAKRLPPDADLNVIENPTSASRKINESFAQLTTTNAFQNYFNEKDSWRQIDDDYLGSADDLAIKLNTGVNNTSLVLAFEIEQTNEVLFFSGDAEFGVWKDWDTDQTKRPGQRQYTWTLPDPASRRTRTVTVEELMANTILYKMGHHGSQNATPNTRGLAKLSNPHLHCMIPVDQAKAKTFEWFDIPFKDILTTLDNRGIPYIRADESKQANLDLANSRQRPLPSGSQVEWAIDTQNSLYVDWTLTIPQIP